MQRMKMNSLGRNHRLGKMWLKCTVLVLIGSLFSGLLSTPVLAQVGPSTGGRSVVTLGADLTDRERQTVVDRLDPPEDVERIEVTNQEEREALADYVPMEQIGSRAISSSLVTVMEGDDTIEVDTEHITWVTRGMYINALQTAGIQAARVKVVAPFDVSGTAALTGIMKAFEVAAGETLDAERKETAAQELGLSVDIAQRTGDGEKVADLIARIKGKVAESGGDLNDQEIREIVVETAAELNIQLTDEEIGGLVTLIQRITAANVDWDLLAQEAQKVWDQVAPVMDNPGIQSLLQRLKDWLFRVLTDLIPVQ